MEPRVIDIWAYTESNWSQADLTGFQVEASDGGIGKVDEASNEVGSSYVVVDTGPWIFGKKVLLPAGVVQNVDFDSETIYVNRTKDEIKDAPEFDAGLGKDPDYRAAIARHYGAT
jgi:PRC-barrel domain